MKRFLNTLITVGIASFFHFCDNPTGNVQNRSVFKVEINGIQKSGSGTAFVYSDTLLHIRGRLEEVGFERQIDILIDTVKSGRYLISKNNGTLNDIIGGDAVANHYSTPGLPDDSISYEIDPARKQVFGEFKAVFIDSLSHDTLRLSKGSFNMVY